MTETLNIDYHRCKLILKSLNCSKTIRQASSKCGITTRTMYTWMKNYDIVKNKDNKYERKNLMWQVSIQ